MAVLKYCVGLLLACLLAYIPQGNCQARQCPTGMNYTECGSACNRTCTDPNPICTEQCVKRCQCAGTTVLDNNGRCIQKARCPKNVKCPTGMVFNECGSACNSTCTNPNPICTANCVSRCECPKGTVLYNGGCIGKSRCPRNNGTTEAPPEPKKCKIGSPLKDRNGSEIFCGRGLHRQKCPSGSSCVIDATDRFAVCCATTACKYGQVFKQCASACPPQTCDGPVYACTKQCVQKCECPSDTPILFKERCIERAKCPSTLTCDNSYSPMKPFVRRVPKMCNRCRWWSRGCTKTVDCSYDEKTCCPGYRLYWNQCKTECGGCSNKAVYNQEPCFHRNQKAKPYCCPGFSLQYLNRQARCMAVRVIVD